MKALVLGTSNSVMREGWLSLTREMAANKGLYVSAVLITP